MEKINEPEKEVNLLESLRNLSKQVEQVLKVEPPTYEEFHYSDEGLEVEHD